MFPLLFGIYIIVVVIQIGYYGLLLSRFSFHKKQHVATEKHPISLLIACKNEEENLKKNFPKLLAQKYPEFEIILVDDASTDATLSVIETFAQKNDHVHFISLPKTDTYFGNKKHALTLAIQKASYDYLLFTDADCMPSSVHWIDNMAAQFVDTKQLILGYGSYQNTGSWLNKLIRYETLLTAWQYFSYALTGYPYMGVGRNMGYTKSFFKKANGFQSHMDIRSGDDDLIVNNTATKKNTAICWQSDSHTVSNPKSTLTEWIQQKRRHITTATSYKLVHQILLGFFFSSQFLFYVLSISLLIIGVNTQLVFFLIGIRFLIYFVGLFPTAKKLNEKDLILWAPLLEFFLIVLQMCIFILNLVQKPSKW